MELLTILEDAGISGLRTTRREIEGRCPMHLARVGKEDTHPSWSINKQTYLHFCHSCGYKGNLNGLIMDILGEVPEDLIDTMRTQGFLRDMAKVREDPSEVLAPVMPVLTEWALQHLLAPVPQRLLEFRHLVRWAIDRYQVRWELDQKRYVLPIRDPAGGLLGAQYRQKGSVLTLPEGMEKSGTLFGYSTMAEFDYTVLVESPLDAVRLFGLGIPAVAALGAWVSADQVRLLARAFSRVYVALDNDKAGFDSCQSLFPGLRRAGCVPVSWVYDEMVDEDGEAAKDPGDATDDALRASWERTTRWGVL